MENEIKRLLKDDLLKLPSEDFTAKTMQKIRVIQDSHKVKRRISRWFIVSPLAAAAALALFLIFFWPAGTPGTVSWADVQRQLEQVHTMTARFCHEFKAPNGKWRNEYRKIYIKDPGLSRIDWCDTGADLNTLKSGPITVLKDESGIHERLWLNPYSHLAEWIIRKGRTVDMPPVVLLPGDSTQMDNNYALGLWDQLKQITAAVRTKRIGKRIINGKPAVGFGFEVPVFQPIYKESTCGKIWVGRDDGVPLLIELDYKDYLGKKVQRLEWSHIQWNIPLEEKLFDFTVPEGWSLKRDQENESIEYTGFGFKPGVTLEIGPEGQEPFVTAADIAGVVKAERTTYLFPKDTQLRGLITIELMPAAANRLSAYSAAHPDKIIVVNFNGQKKVAAKLDAAHPTQVSFDITLIHITSNIWHFNYITPLTKRNK